MFGDYAEKFNRRLIDFVVFGLLDLLQYFLVAFVVGTATKMVGYSVAANYVALSAALIVAATILNGGMPKDT